MLAEVAVIIPTYNNLPYLTPAVRGLLASAHGVTLSLLVVNNGEPGSCDSLVVAARTLYGDSIDVADTGKNLGWEGGLATGVKLTRAPLLLFANDDVSFPDNDPRWLARLCTHLDDPQVGAVGPVSNYVLSHQLADGPTAEPARSVSLLSGFCVLVRRAALKDAGGIDTALPGGDDLDLSVRLVDAGYTLLVDPSVFVYHHPSPVNTLLHGGPDRANGYNSPAWRGALLRALVEKHGAGRLLRAHVTDQAELDALDGLPPSAVITTQLARVRGQRVRARICLCMIVKDEAAIITRALESALPWIDAWSIVDTGSTDDTPARIERAMSGLPGQLLYQPWTNFAVNRTAAFDAARGMGTDYILVMDADQTLVVDDADALAGLEADSYNLIIEHGSISYPHQWLLKADLPWHWVGTTHEYLDCEQTNTVAPLPAVRLVEYGDSSRRTSGAKVTEDLALLEATLAEEPDNGRAAYYLAQTYQQLRRFDDALALYDRASTLGGWTEEIWSGSLQRARILEEQGKIDQAILGYLQTYTLDPVRTDALYYLATGYLNRKELHLARLFFEEVCVTPKPVNRVWVDNTVYDWAGALGFVTCCHGLGLHDDAEEVEQQLLARTTTPDAIKDHIRLMRETQTIVPLAYRGD